MHEAGPASAHSGGRAPRVSVLTTTFNGAALIGQTVESVLGQTFADLELVVVDDCSTDDTPRVLAAYADPRLRVVRAPRNLGVGGSRNFGFSQVRGEFVAALDHDDLSLPTRLARQVDYLDQHPDVLLVGTDDWLMQQGRLRAANPPFATDPAFMRWLLLLRNPIAYSSIMVRAEAVRRLGRFMREERIYADDFDLYHQLLASGEVGRIDARLTVYRLHGGNTFRAREGQMIGNAELVLRETYQGLVGAEAAETAGLVARFLFARKVAQTQDLLGRLALGLGRLRQAFCARHAADPALAMRIERHVERLLIDVARRHIRGGSAGSVRPLLRRPAVRHALVAAMPVVAASALIGMVPARRALRTLAGRIAMPASPQGEPVIYHGRAYRPAPRDRDRPPTLFVVVDTEAEFDWSKPFSRDLTRITSIPAAGDVQAVFDRYGLRPVYVVDYPVATQAEAYMPLRDMLRRGACEIGAHHHPWTTPPIEETPNAANSYPGNLPPELEARKLASLFAAIRANFGIDPLFYKAGRYGLGAATPELIAALGARVDFSVLPGADLRRGGGPDFRAFRATPYDVDGAGILTMPMTRAELGLLSHGPAWLGELARSPCLRSSRLRALRLGGVLARARLLEAVTLTPEGVSAGEQMRLLDALLCRGHRSFVLHYHSPSLVPGHTPYVRTPADAREFRTRIETVLEHFLGRIGGLPGNPRDLLPPELRQAGLSEALHAAA